jgi:hypothetical protein
MCGSLELFNLSKKMTRRGQHVQRGWYPLVLQMAYPHRSLSYTHTHLKWSHELYQQLDAMALAVAQLVHPPLRVDAQHLHQLVPAFGVRVLELLHHLRDGDVHHERDTAPRERHRLEAPSGLEVGPVKVETRIAKRIQAQDRYAPLRLREVPPGNEAEQRRLAAAVGPEEQTLQPPREG